MEAKGGGVMFKAKEKTIPCPAKTTAIAIRNQARECFKSRSSQACSAQQLTVGFEDVAEDSEGMNQTTCA